MLWKFEKSERDNNRVFVGFYGQNNDKGRLTGLGPVIYNCDGITKLTSMKSHHSAESNIKDATIDVPSILKKL